MRRLLAYQAIWGMESLPGVDIDGDMEGALDRICAAGFDGVGVALLRKEQSEAVSRGMRERGKTWEATAFVRHREDLVRSIDRAERLGAHHLNVQIVERLDRVSGAVALVEDMQTAALAAGIPVHYETHRGRLTNDLLFTCRMLDALPDLKLTGDISHYVLVHEMPLPVPDVDLKRMSRILDQCWGLHGRVAGSHQVQVSIQAPQHAEWFAQFRTWWGEAMTSWIARSGPDAELSFMSELGPPNYAITGPDGKELCDRWTEAVMLKDMARELWAAANASALSPNEAIGA